MKNCELLVADEARFTLPWIDQYEGEYYEGKCSELIKEAPMDFFIDIGAAFGYYAALAHIHHPDLRSLSIEANPLRAGCLNWSLMPLERAETTYGYTGLPTPVRPTVPWGMVSHRDETETCLLSATHINPMHWLRKLRMFSKKLRTFVKIDVEGGEMEVLKVMEEELTNPLTAWLIEVHRQFVRDEQILELFPGRAITQFQDHGLYVKLFINYAE